MLFGPSGNKRLLDHRAFVPSADEAAYLLSAVWLHDVGMMSGIFPDEVTEGEDVDWESFRDKHELRSAKYIQECWQHNCDHWESHEKTQLAEICIHHRQRYPLETMSPVQTDGRDGKPVRLRELAAILRVADACHVDKTRTPYDLRGLFRAFTMPAKSREHWGIPVHIHEVRFDQEKKIIEPRCYIPRVQKYGLATVDFQLAVDRVVQRIQTEIDTTKPYLASYSNTAYENVEPDISRPGAMGDPQKFLREMWPCMLAVTGSASEVSSMLAATFLAVVGDRKQLPGAEINEVLSVVRKHHPYNFLVRRLTDDLTSFMESGTSVDEVRKYLENHVAKRVAAGPACH
jgi:hypothetical protein